MKAVIRILKVFIALPVMAAIELLALLVCWSVAVFRPNWGRRIANWICDHLPDHQWYFA